MPDGVTIPFLIKHIRPLGTDAFAEICGPHGMLRAFLRTQRWRDEEINEAFVLWAAASDLDPSKTRNEGAFVAAATYAAIARWSEVSPTTLSTVFFMDQPIWREFLARAQTKAGQHYRFDATEPGIPIAVTVPRNNPNNVVVSRAVTSIQEVWSNGDGDCYHLQAV